MKAYPWKSLTISFYIWGTFVVAYILAAVPLPDSARFCRPDFLMLFVLFWVFMLTKRLNLVHVWIAGICMDVHVGTLLGQYALALTTMLLITRLFHNRLRLLSTWQQLPYVAFLIVIGKLCLFITTWLTKGQASPDLYLLSTGMSILSWPIIDFLLTPLLRKCNKILMV